MKILFVSNSPTQTVVTVSLGYDIQGYEIHLYNHGNGYTECWTKADDFVNAEFYHKELCMKCGIKTNM